jgi:hypothetical protein
MVTLGLYCIYGIVVFKLEELNQLCKMCRNPLITGTMSLKLASPDRETKTLYASCNVLK